MGPAKFTNYDEIKTSIERNTIWHSRQYASTVPLPSVRQ